jgi:hypothetical protein
VDQAAYDAYVLDESNYGQVEFKPKTNPLNSWTFPIVTGHKYKIHWGWTGVDFEKMRITLSDRWEETDKNLYLVHNFTDVRALMDVKIGQQWFFNNSLPPAQDINDNTMLTGQNMLYPQKDFHTTEEFHMVINGKNLTGYPENNDIRLEGHRCDGPCLEDLEDAPTEEFKRRWSNPNDWPSGAVPLDGEDVEIEPGWDMIYDLDDSTSASGQTPTFRVVTVNGWLTFQNGQGYGDITLRAKHIFVRAGQIHIGREDAPFQNVAKIVLYGEKEFETMVYDAAIEAGNKLIANVGRIKMYGKPRKQTMTRLMAPA